MFLEGWNEQRKNSRPNLDSKSRDMCEWNVIRRNINTKIWPNWKKWIKTNQYFSNQKFTLPATLFLFTKQKGEKNKWKESRRVWRSACESYKLSHWLRICCVRAECSFVASILALCFIVIFFSSCLHLAYLSSSLARSHVLFVFCARLLFHFNLIQFLRYAMRQSIWDCIECIAFVYLCICVKSTRAHTTNQCTISRFVHSVSDTLIC